VTLIDFIGIFWVTLAIGLILWLKVFSPSSLANSPPRHSTLSVIHLAGVFLLYIGAMILAQAVFFAIFPHALPGPTTAAATTAATASAPASQSGGEDNLINAHLQIVASFALFIPAALLLLLVRSNVGIHAWGFSLRLIPGALWRGALAFFITMPLMGGLQVIIEYIIKSLGRKESAPHVVIQMVQNNDIPPHVKAFLVITAVVIAPIVEEMFFRGFLQTIFIQPAKYIVGAGGTTLRFGKPSALRRWIVIIAVAAVFASIHYDFKSPNPEHLPLLFLLGVALGYTYERTGNLWACITLHALFNGSVLISLNFAGS